MHQRRMHAGTCPRAPSSPLAAATATARSDALVLGCASSAGPFRHDPCPSLISLYGVRPAPRERRLGSSVFKSRSTGTTVISTRSCGPSGGHELLLWHHAHLAFGEPNWPMEVASLHQKRMTRARKRRFDAPARASGSGSSPSFAPTWVISKPDPVLWAVKKKRTISALAQAADAFLPDSSDAGQEQQLKCYTRRKYRTCCVSAAPAAALPEEHCEEKNEAKPPKLRGHRSSRKRREIPPAPFATIFPETPIANDDGNNNGNAPEPEAAVGRPRRQRKRKIDKEFVRSDSMFFDWRTTYPDEPCPPDYGDEPEGYMELGAVETVAVYEEGASSDMSDAVERPMSLKSQIDTQQTRKARRILVEDARFAIGPRHEQERTEAPPVSPPAQQHDEAAMCPPTPEKLQESNAECEPGDRPPSTPSESAPDKDSCISPSEGASPRAASARLPHSAPVDTVVIQAKFSVEVKVNLRKKHTRPKVKRPEKVKVAKPLKIPKPSQRKNDITREAFEHNSARSRAKGAALQEHSYYATATAEITPQSASGRRSERQNESAPSSQPAESVLVVTAEVPHTSAQIIDKPFAMARGRNTLAEGEICIKLPILVSSSGTSNQQEYEDGLGERSALIVENGAALERRAECNPRLEEPGGSEVTMEGITEADVEHRSSSVIRCIPNFGGVDPGSGGSWMEEAPPSTPRGNAMVVLPPTDPCLSSRFFSQPSFGNGDSATDSDGEQTGRALRTRRSLLSALPPVAQLDIPFFKMSKAQKRQHAWALCKDPYFSARAPEVLVDRLIVGTPKRLRLRLWNNTHKLVLDILKMEVGAVAPAYQLGRSPAAPIPLPILSRESSAQAQGQLVVYGQRRELVVYRERTKVKYKPKVLLDSLTVQTFDRLMLQGGEVKDADHADEDWVEARKLWEGRARHFNDIMRQVQGNRTFSKWGGSLLDSVVGAFLTQNVSDFLSSNAFMGLRAHFPVREASRSETGVSLEEQATVTASGCPVGTSSDTDLSTPLVAEEDQSDHSVGGLKKNVADAGIDDQPGSVFSIPEVEIQHGQVVSEVSITHNQMDTTFVEKSIAPLNVFAELPSTDEADQLNQSDPYSFSDEERSVNSDLVIAFDKVQIGSIPFARGSCPPMEMARCSVVVTHEHGTANVDNETSPVTDTAAEVTPEVAQAVQHGGDSLKEHHSNTQADTEDKGEKGNNQRDMAGSPGQTVKAPSLSPSILEAKFQRSLGDDILIPDKTLAATLKAILGKQTTRREAAKDQVAPLDVVKWKAPRNKSFKRRTKTTVDRVRANIKLLTGADRGNYELKVSYKLKLTSVPADAMLNRECERDPFTADSVDWDAVRRADLEEIADVIKARGMNFILGGRIKSLLERIHHDQDGRLDLEWIRKLLPTDAQSFLMSVRGLGLKSVECIRLLTLHHPSFPVDTNVGRIVVRLGWVPLEPLPEETQLHLLEMYPIQEHIQKYMWPRLCTLDQETLYEFHYQLITFGKVFCTKSKPNCNACPLRSQCKHYESAYCSARPLLEGRGEASNNSMRQIESVVSRLSVQRPLGRRQSLLMLGDQARGACIPIIEEPSSPEHVADIEDAPGSEDCTNGGMGDIELVEVDPDIEPSAWWSDSLAMMGNQLTYVEVNETPTQASAEVGGETTTEDAVQETEVSIEDVVEEAMPQSSAALSEEVARLPSRELVLMPPAAASFPAPLLRTIERLRTIHYVYELPDHHPLLAKMDKRDPEDPCSYLLAIWNPDEVPEAMPKIGDDDASNPFACSQPSNEAVRGTLLVPCRTAMRGSFPLNGTYFQVNEVFADHASSALPIDVPRTLLWDLRRKFVYFGTSVTSIFRNMSQEEIQCCFKKGYVCVRAFDQKTRQPKLLAARLHQSGAKIVAGRTLAQKARKAKQARRGSKSENA